MLAVSNYPNNKTIIIFTEIKNKFFEHVQYKYLLMLLIFILFIFSFYFDRTLKAVYFSKKKKKKSRSIL